MKIRAAFVLAVLLPSLLLSCKSGSTDEPVDMRQPTEVAAAFFRALETHDNDLFNQVVAQRRDEELGFVEAILDGDLSVDYEDLKYTETRVDDRHTEVLVTGRVRLEGDSAWSDLGTIAVNLVLAGDDTTWYVQSIGQEFP